MSSSSVLNNRNQTFFWDRIRAISTGIVETGIQTFFLFIAIRVFDAGPLSKGFIAAAMPIGLLASPVLVNISANAGWNPSRSASLCTLAGTLAVLGSLLFQSLPVFVVSVILFSSSHSLVIPLITQIYQDNYDESERGRLFTWAAMVRIITSGLFAWLGGIYLDRNLDNWTGLMLVFGFASVIASVAIWRFPSQRRVVPRRSNPFHALIYVRKDAVFRNVLITQMMMGIGMMMVIPLRVEYLANEAYGLMFAPSIVALLTTIVPSGSRLAFSPVWGHLFDRVNFFALRIVLNLISVAALLVFFFSTTLPMLIFGMLIFGVFRAGGEVAWSLWVTKVAPSHLVADYMSVHTLFTGIRGIFAPFIGFYAATMLPLQTVATLSACLLLSASLLLFPELRNWRKMHPGGPIVSNVGAKN